MHNVEFRNTSCIQTGKLYFGQNRHNSQFAIENKQNITNFKLVDKCYNQILTVKKNFAQSKNNTDVSFKSIESWNRVLADNPNIAYSHLFRGRSYHCDYQDVVDILKYILGERQPLKSLLVGVGHGEEFASIVAIVSELTNHKSIEKVLDVNLVDLNPAPSINFSCYKPNYAKTSFEIVDKIDSSGENYRECVLKSSLMDYIRSVFDDHNPLNPNARSKWDTDIRNFVKSSEGKQYDLISCNNVYHYMNKEDQKYVWENFVRMLKDGGVLITDPFPKSHPVTKLINKKMMQEKSPGIWVKLSQS